MTKALSVFCAAVALLTLPLGASAVPVQVGLGAFGPGATTFSFGDSGPPSLPGISFSGSVQQTPGGAGSGWGAVSAPSFNSAFFESTTITFDTPVQQVGFYFGGNTVNTVPLDVGLGGGTTGSFVLQTFGTDFSTPADGINNWIFFGFYDPDGIDSLTFHPELNNDWTVGIGELTVGGVAIPEPLSVGLFGLGLAGLGLIRRKRAA